MKHAWYDRLNFLIAVVSVNSLHKGIHAYAQVGRGACTTSDSSLFAAVCLVGPVAQQLFAHQMVRTEGGAELSERYLTLLACSRTLELVEKPTDLMQEWKPSCQCPTPCQEFTRTGWACPNRYSLAKLFYATGGYCCTLKQRTPALQWLLIVHNFNYMYFRCEGTSGAGG